MVGLLTMRAEVPLMALLLLVNLPTQGKVDLKTMFGL